MGNCLSPLLADLYMDDYIEKHLTDVNQPNKLWRYVDDIFIITRHDPNPNYLGLVKFGFG